MQIQFPGFFYGNQKAVFQPRKTMLQVKQLERASNAEEIAKKEQESVKLQISEAAKALQEQVKQMESEEQTDWDKVKYVEQQIHSVKHCYTRMETVETLEEKQLALRELRKLQEYQVEQAKRQAREAQEEAGQISKQQDELNRSNSELLVMLESMEEMEEDEELREAEKGNQTSEEETKSEENEPEMTSQAARVSDLVARDDERILQRRDEILQSGKDKVASAKGDCDLLTEQIQQIYAVMGDDRYSEEEKQMVLSSFVELASTINWKNDFFDKKKIGLQQIHNAREITDEFNKSDHHRVAQETQEMMIKSAIAKKLQQASQEIVDEHSEELAQRVEEKIDERNEVDKPQDVPEEEIESEEVVVTQPDEETVTEEMLLEQRKEELQENKKLRNSKN